MQRPTFAVHFLTTGPDPRRDRVVEIAAVSLAKRDAPPFDTLVGDSRPLPMRLRKASGLCEEDLRQAPPFEDAIRRLGRYLDGATAVVCGAETARALSSAHAGSAAGGVVDLADLARFVVPTADAFDLETLCPLCGAAPPAPRALPVARAVAEVWTDLNRRLSRLPPAVLEAAASLVAPLDHPLRALLAESAGRAVSAVGPRATIEDLFAGGEGAPGPVTRAAPAAVPRRLEVEKVREPFLPGGAFQRALATYEHRPEQVRMAEEVCRAYNEGAILLVEAGTGTGKSLAYLVPSVLWTAANRQQVVVSTSTKNLQTQLFEKDLPLVRRALGIPFTCALIKGRGNYLCLRKFLYLLKESDRELTPDERADLLPFLVWAAETETGDVAENGAFMSRFSAEVWSRLSCTRPGECVGPRCRVARRCFVRRARARSLQADVIVANHAVVFSEMDAEGVVLPPYEHVIFDEAHNVERVATEHLALRLSPPDVYRVLNRLHRPGRGGAGTGLFTNIRFQLSRLGQRAPAATARDIASAVALALADMEHLAKAVEACFAEVGRILDPPGGARARSAAREAESRLRYDGLERRPETWDDVERAAGALCDALKRLAARLTTVRDHVKSLGERLTYHVDFDRALAAEAETLCGLVDPLRLLVEAQDEAFVYWIERVRRGRQPEYALCAAPLNVGRVLAEQVYARKSTVVFSSATLTTEGTFDFARSRLGLEEWERNEPGRVRTAALGSSFDFGRQVLLGVPLFLPEPTRGERAFEKRLAEMLEAVFRATGGRGLALFTSYEMLNATYAPLKEALEREGICVLGQGLDGERSTLTRLFERDVSSVLLGTQSFWEGVDVPGEALSCLALAKLPFEVFTDPIVQARCERLRAQGRDPFQAYSVPQAVIRLRQGFGRLVRHRHDRGVILICDKRVATRGYGRRFLDSLPVEGRVFASLEELVEAVGRFLGRMEGANQV